MFDANDYIFQQAVTCNQLQTRYGLNARKKSLHHTNSLLIFGLHYTFFGSLVIITAGSIPEFQRPSLGSYKAIPTRNCSGFRQYLWCNFGKTSRVSKHIRSKAALNNKNN
jgi:23S rRNA A1618 N6-methylase RlmF